LTVTIFGNYALFLGEWLDFSLWCEVLKILGDTDYALVRLSWPSEK